MKLLYGTSNLGKLQQMKDMLSGLDFEIIGLNELDLYISNIDENGNNPIDNAKIKAITYYREVKMPVFSCDSGLYIEGLSDEEQPGVHVRRVRGKMLNDEEMINYYSNLALRAGGEVKAKYKNAICFVLDETTIYEYDGEDISSETFLITSKIHPKRIKGFPIDSLSLNIDNKKYYLDIDDYNRNENKSKLAIGVRNFFNRAVQNSIIRY